MAPILSLSEQVRQVQEEIVKLNLKLKELTEAFAAVRHDADMEDLNGQVRSRLSQFRSLIDQLRRLAEAQSHLEAQAMLMADVENHSQSLITSQRQFRQANLQCIQQLERRTQDQLMSSSSSSSPGRGPGPELGGGVRARRPVTSRDELLQENGQATDHLASISRQLAATVQRSAHTVEELAISSQTVSETQGEFNEMGSVIGQSRKLITKYGRRETTDRVLIFFAFAFFFACVFYILRKRVLGPLDPFSLIWASVSTLIVSLLNLVGLK
ncbi:hypothetical protein TCAL_00133 [Tigriopus californicus]|uniref:Sec20 C-terminal domain-containing protein n=1 Tax=Tigriopus californicus TaxID=6832 RepID=A0A553PFW2_TIGCA|nr:vesicle transport protein SEC20-like [Tigriopus californicus]TRY76569.1 hypothetical protein TCAL_00133 [Tigriopus californicus]|eukprot:TCALIF_00133-PA protein Name:"Similar to BNIP1 Vesicle transport protein SEC20 (Homo sapiens)" AED:0.46 eAED:0.46 QI:0/-1/0/1/-1/1/1/0/269